MKKIIAILMIGILLVTGAAAAEEHTATNQAGTGWSTGIAGGWETVSDPAVTDEIRVLFDKAMEGLLGVNYLPVVYLGKQIVAGCNHAILCQATTVYPGAAPRWVIVYLYENLEGGVEITDISDLNW